MKRMILAAGIAAALGSVAASAQTLTITSPAFAQGGNIPSKFTCDAAQAVNPELVFGNVPANAQSLVLIMDDPDVPKTMIPSGEFVHWLVWDLAGNTKSIPEGAPQRGINGTGRPGYMGPCPPDKSHRYFFKLYALSAKLEGTYKNKAELEKAMEGKVIQKAELMANYEKVKK